MNFHRRRSLQRGGLVLVGALMGSVAFYRSRSEQVWPHFLSAAKTREGKYIGVVVDQHLNILSTHLLPGRGHAAAFNRHTNDAIFFARRPEDWLHIVSLVSESRMTLRSSRHRHFYGHGIVDERRQLLLTTENNTQTGEGVIGLRRMDKGYAHYDEIPSYGIGPHELVWMPDKTAFVVANGGLLTKPGLSRTPLNIDSMQPNVSVVSWPDGRLLRQYYPRNHKMSWRHLSVDRRGMIFVGAQYQGDKLNKDGLFYRISLKEVQNNSMIDAYWLGGEHATDIKQYTASVVVARDNQANFSVVSCPRGGKLLSIDNEGRVQSLDVDDVAGVGAALGHRVVYSSGYGELGALDMSNGMKHLMKKQFSVRWDNHLCAV